MGAPVLSVIDQEITATEPVRRSTDADPCHSEGKVWYDRDLECIHAYVNYTE
jgi:hypothetical protein